MSKTNRHPDRRSAEKRGSTVAQVPTSGRLLSPAERIQRAVEPWIAYFILPLFAFTATGVDLSVQVDSSDDVSIVLGVVLGLVIGKPLGILLASWIAIKSGLGAGPTGTTVSGFVGAACLCGVGVTVAMLMANEAFPTGGHLAIAKIGVLIGSVVAAALGTAIVLVGKRQVA